eukprot:1185844-Prorocentrum_minimum.AAC.5
MRGSGGGHEGVTRGRKEAASISIPFSSSPGGRLQHERSEKGPKGVTKGLQGGHKGDLQGGCKGLVHKGVARRGLQVWREGVARGHLDRIQREPATVGSHQTDGSGVSGGPQE